MRLDQFLTETGRVETRNKAQALVKEGKVTVNGAVVTKPSASVPDGAEVTVTDEKLYVSRAAGKLLGYLAEYPVEIAGKTCLDVGSSTGGFVEALLEAGAASVTAVDVGRDQLHPRLREDSRVFLHEETDIRAFDPGRRFPVVTCDVSFISLLHILKALDNLAAGTILLLFKPQFEVGKEARRDRNGVVKDAAAVDAARVRFEEACAALGWRPVRRVPSTVIGKEGNLEEVYHYEKTA